VEYFEQAHAAAAPIMGRTDLLPARPISLTEGAIKDRAKRLAAQV
jgi:hypothetical protein